MVLKQNGRKAIEDKNQDYSYPYFISFFTKQWQLFNWNTRREHIFNSTSAISYIVAHINEETPLLWM